MLKWLVNTFQPTFYSISCILSERVSHISLADQVTVRHSLMKTRILVRKESVLLNANNLSKTFKSQTHRLAYIHTILPKALSWKISEVLDGTGRSGVNPGRTVYLTLLAVVLWTSHHFRAVKFMMDFVAFLHSVIHRVPLSPFLHFCLCTCSPHTLLFLP